ncbi:coiled-coil domain-containing protein [Angustibacter luteus]|uniref:Transposase n=1 Tax=Angustibacter luteus TaxID=658456 RepID=A0ABW1JE39_9ACTN
MDIEAVVDELYRLPPDEFTGRRDELAADAKADGDAALAKQVKALRRPTASAALMNQLARDESDSLADYLELGEQLREAQANLSGDDLRRLGQERQRAAATLVKRAVLLSAGPVSPAVCGELDATLLAAVADPAAGQAVVSGALTRALSYAGLGEVDITAATATPLSSTSPAPRTTSGGPPPSPAPASGDGTRRRSKEDQLAERRTAADERLSQAEEDIREAARAVQASMQAELDAEQAQQTAEREVEDLREKLTQARFAVRAAQQQLTTAHSDRATAERAVSAAEKARDKAKRQRDILGED